MNRFAVVLICFLLAGLTGCAFGPDSGPEAATESEVDASAVNGAPSAPRPESTAESAGAYDPEMAGACERTCAAKGGYDESEIVAQPGAIAGEFTRCPVSGVVFEVQAANPSGKHAGHEHFLCCEGCAEKFRPDPERFVRL